MSNIYSKQLKNENDLFLRGDNTLHRIFL